MSMENNINTFFENLENLNVLDPDFSKNIQHAYTDFFKYDRASVSEDPYELKLDDEQSILREGRFFSDYKGAHFECYFKSGTVKDRLIAVFGGARFTDKIPQFRRWSWYPFIDGHIVCFEDPMYYQHPDLKLGWFYGNNKEDYAVYAAEIVKLLAHRLGVHNDKNIIMYGSSGGGTAAIRAGAFLNGCRVAVINPQLDICHYIFTRHFEQIVNVHLEEEDLLHRNNLAFLMRQNSKTDFLLVVNAESKMDTRVQLKALLDDWNYDQKLNYGLTKIGNTVIWMYDGPGKEPHYVQENYRTYSYIQYLLKSMDEEDLVKKHQNEVIYINDWWRNQAQASIEKKRLEKAVRMLTEHRDRVYKKTLGLVSDDSTIYHDTMTARIAIVNCAADTSSEACNDFEWRRVSDPEARIRTPIWELTSGQGYVLEADKGKLTFEVQCIGAGDLELKLRGPFKRDERGLETALCLDYTSLQINGEMIFNDKHSVWHKSPYIYRRKGIKDGDVIKCAVTWEEHIE